MGELQDLLRAVPDDFPSFQNQFGPASKKVEMQTSVVLAQEWKRVKACEPGYRRAMSIAFFALCFSVAAAVISLWILAP